MSLSSKFQKAKAQGYIRTFELVFNRLIPPWIFRYCTGEIFDLDIQKLAALNEQPGEDVDGVLVAKCLVNGDDASDQSTDSQRFIEDNLGLDYILTKDQAWLYCAFVDGDARGRGVYKKLLSFVAQDVEKRGFSQLMTVINPWNRVSRGAHEKQSKRICGSVSCIRVFSLAWISRSGNVEVDKRLVTSIKKNPSNVTMN